MKIQRWGAGVAVAVEVVLRMSGACLVHRTKISGSLSRKLGKRPVWEFGCAVCVLPRMRRGIRLTFFFGQGLVIW
jgi:hypothetical protein